MSLSYQGNEPTDILGLVLNCPKGQPDEDCPSSPLRDKPLEAIIEHLESLNTEQIQELRDHHRMCWQRAN